MSTCPSCGSRLPAGPPADCPACGFAAGEAKQAAMRVYVITAAFFFSVLMYAVLVFILPHEQKPIVAMGSTVTYLLGGLGAVCLAVVLLWPAPPERLTAQALMTQVVFQAAIAEAPALLGLLGYLLTTRIEAFVLPLGLSAVGFGALASRIPRLVRAMERQMLDDKREKKR